MHELFLLFFWAVAAVAASSTHSLTKRTAHTSLAREFHPAGQKLEPHLAKRTDSDAEKLDVFVHRDDAAAAAAAATAAVLPKDWTSNEPDFFPKVFTSRGQEFYRLDSPDGPKVFAVGKLLGKGAGGTVYLAKDLTSADKLVALKIGPNDPTSTAEIATLERLNYLVASRTVNGASVWAMHLVPGTPLVTLYERYYDIWCRDDHALLREILRRVARRAILPLLESGYSHQDLNFCNVLVADPDPRDGVPPDDVEHIRPIDFGLGVWLEKRENPKADVKRSIRQFIRWTYERYGHSDVVKEVKPQGIAPGSEGCVKSAREMYTEIVERYTGPFEIGGAEAQDFIDICTF